MEYLAITDADAIHPYVFAPSELRLIRGGSNLLESCNQEAARFIEPTAREIFSGGGSVLAAFRDEAGARNFCGKVQELYRQKTGIATVSSAWAPYPSRDRFIETHDELRLQLERRKQRRMAGHFNGGSPWFASCQACGLYPASSTSMPPEAKLICNPCWLREQQAIRLRRENENEPQSFEDIASKSRPRNYLAVIYFDFDRLGRKLKRIVHNEDQYRTLSRRVRTTISRAVAEADKRIGQKYSNSKGSVPLILGGDDAVVVMAAQDALVFLHAFQESIGNFWARDEMPPNGQTASRPSFSAGMVIAHSHFPIAEFMRIAENLLKSAKRINAPDEITGENHASAPAEMEDAGDHDSIDYEVITNSMVGEVVKQREMPWNSTLRPARLHRLRTAKPYRWRDFLALADTLGELKKTGAPASKIKALYHIAYESDLQAELEYLHLLSRLDARHRRILRKPEAVGLGLWRTGDDGSVTTRAADLTELWEFV